MILIIFLVGRSFAQVIYDVMRFIFLILRAKYFDYVTCVKTEIVRSNYRTKRMSLPRMIFENVCDSQSDKI